MKMKLLIAIGVPSVLFATNMFAGLTTTLDLAPNGYRDQNSVGGEFTAVTSGGPNYVANYNSQATAQVMVNGSYVTGFETFCVEMNQSFNPGHTYNTSVGSSIVSGPYSSTYVTVGTAYLYSQFAQGSLTGYNYNVGQNRELSADELQDAIWYLQGELGPNGNSSTSDSLYKFVASKNPFIALVDTLFGINGAKASDASNNYGVQVLNLTTGSGWDTQYAQDQLVYTPGPQPTPVPEPATFAAGAMLLAPLGLSLLRSFRKKS
jgi:hypothetical protein